MTNERLPIVERLRARKESVYDHATQGAEWQDDTLCIEAADTIAALLEAMEAFITGADNGWVSVEVDKAVRDEIAKARGPA
jgi:hypothetical protein